MKPRVTGSTNFWRCSDYIFFASYLQPPIEEGAGLWSNSDELERVNGKSTNIHFNIMC
jgi:hypothetical protein